MGDCAGHDPLRQPGKELTDMTAAAVRRAAEGESAGIDLPMEPWAYGLIAFGLLVLLLLLTLSFGKDR